MRLALFLGCFVVVMLGFGILTGTVGTRTVVNVLTGETTYHFCVVHGSAYTCWPVPQSVMPMLSVLKIPNV